MASELSESAPVGGEPEVSLFQSLRYRRFTSTYLLVFFSAPTLFAWSLLLVAGGSLLISGLDEDSLYFLRASPFAILWILVATTVFRYQVNRCIEVDWKATQIRIMNGGSHGYSWSLEEFGKLSIGVGKLGGASIREPGSTEGLALGWPVSALGVPFVGPGRRQSERLADSVAERLPPTLRSLDLVEIQRMSFSEALRIMTYVLAIPFLLSLYRRW